MRMIMDPETFHTIFIPELPPQIIVDPEAERAEKLLAYYRKHRVMARYKLLFREFVAKVDAGSWNPYLAEWRQ